MELTEDEFLQKYGKKIAIVIEIHYYHMNMNGAVLVVDIT